VLAGLNRARPTINPRWCLRFDGRTDRTPLGCQGSHCGAAYGTAGGDYCSRWSGRAGTVSDNNDSACKGCAEVRRSVFGGEPPAKSSKVRVVAAARWSKLRKRALGGQRRGSILSYAAATAARCGNCGRYRNQCQAQLPVGFMHAIVWASNSRDRATGALLSRYIASRGPTRGKMREFRRASSVTNRKNGASRSGLLRVADGWNFGTHGGRRHASRVRTRRPASASNPIVRRRRKGVRCCRLRCGVRLRKSDVMGGDGWVVKCRGLRRALPVAA